MRIFLQLAKHPLVLISVPWTFLMAFLCALAFLVSSRLGHQFHRTWARGACWCLGIVVRCHHLERVPQTGGLLFVSNHQSMYDIPVLASLPISFKWISKKEVRYIPLIGTTMVAMRCYFVSRKSSSQDLNVMKKVEDGLKRGDRVMIFPEGTRTRTGELLPFKKGAFKTAQNAGVPIVLVAIQGTFGIAPPGQLPQERGHEVSVTFGPPLTAAPGESVEAFKEKAFQTMTSLLKDSTSPW